MHADGEDPDPGLWVVLAEMEQETELPSLVTSLSLCVLPEAT